MSYINYDDLMEWLDDEVNAAKDSNEAITMCEAERVRVHVRWMEKTDASKAMPRWIPVEDETGEGSNTYKCPVCGEVQQLMDGTPEENGWYYCPHCGMRLVHKEKR